jgi:hypothetical protein
MGVGGQRHTLAALSPGKTQYPLCRRLGGLQGWSGWVRKISPPVGFDPQTIQPLASSYTDCAIPAHKIIIDNNTIYYTCLYISIIQADSLWAGPEYSLSAVCEHYNGWHVSSSVSCCHSVSEIFCVLKYGRCSKCCPLAQIFAPHSLNDYDPFSNV